MEGAGRPDGPERPVPDSVAHALLGVLVVDAIRESRASGCGLGPKLAGGSLGNRANRRPEMTLSQQRSWARS